MLGCVLRGGLLEQALVYRAKRSMSMVDMENEETTAAAIRLLHVPKERHCARARPRYPLGRAPKRCRNTMRLSRFDLTPGTKNSPQGLKAGISCNLNVRAEAPTYRSPRSHTENKQAPNRRQPL